jgi:4a-hydroxytetrahydrobiopterin dehydratase
MSDNPATLSSSEVAHALTGLPDWRTRIGALFTVYKAGSSVAAVELVHQIGLLANELDHHPDVDWRYDHVFVRSSTHSVGGAVTALDVDLATRISALAVDAEAKPELFRTVEIGVDTADVESVRDTWAALLKYKPHDDADLFDPWGRGPTVWFQKTDTPDASRLHLDVWVEDDTADAVLAETERAGALRLDDHFRPSFTVIADADGNRFCVCTNLDRAVGGDS